MEEYIVKFFKDIGFYNKEYFEKISKNTTVVNKDYKEIIDFVGFYPEKFKLVLPKIKSVSDILIWIHEYSHALFPEDTDELFPNLMEAYYINNYIKDQSIKNSIKSEIELSINKSKCINHTIAQKNKLKMIK